MRLIILFLSIIIFVSCTKVPKKTVIERTDYDNSKLATGILNYTVPGSWQRVEPSSSMRVDELLIDPISQTKLAIFIFPKIPGIVEANLERWKGQFKEDAVTESTEQFNQGKLPVTIYQAEGTFMEAAEPMNPAAGVTEKEDHKMLTAIIELNDGAWFFKTVGPKQIIDNQKANFDQLIRSTWLVN